MVSQVGDGEQSAFVTIRTSKVPEIDGTCSPVCRWGDYSGAVPDPAAPLGDPGGAVWLANQWVAPDSFWATWIWRATP
jgi:hypothetical protein